MAALDYLALLGVAVLVFSSAELWRRLALRAGILDLPGQRSSHANPTPRGGGIGILIGLLAALALSAQPERSHDHAMLSLLLVGGIGLYDDLVGLRPSMKLLGQALAALPLATAAPIGINLWGEYAGIAASVALVLLLVNTWNFMDGIDGIAVMVAAAFAVAVVLISTTSAFGAAGIAPWLVAACVGFLPLNAPKARLFMGDCGSHALGMAVAIVVLSAPSDGAMLVNLSVAGVFLIDVLGTLVRRAIERESLATAHRRHLYQLAVRAGYSHVSVAIAYAAWALATGVLVAVSERLWNQGGGAALIATGASLICWWVLSSRFERRLRREGSW